MKVVIFAGGRGSRLGTITDSIPKPMVKIGNQPMIWHIMNTYAHYGYKEFVVCLGYKQEIIREFFLNYDRLASDCQVRLGRDSFTTWQPQNTLDWTVDLIYTGAETLRGGRLKKIERYLDDDLNLFTYSDGLADIDINALVRFHKRHKKILTITGVHPPSRFGSITSRGSLVTAFKEKPQLRLGLINGGFGVFDKRIFRYLKDDDDCDLEKDVFEKLVALRQVSVYKHLKNWMCIDTQRELSYLNDLWNQNQAFWRV